MVATYVIIFFFVGIALIFFVYFWWKDRLDMDEEPKYEMLVDEEPGIASADNPIPRWLIATYIVMPLLGLLIFVLYWNGSWGWLDRGYWSELQQAANTTFPEIEKVQNQFKQ